MDVSKTEAVSSQMDLKECAEVSLPSDSLSAQNSSPEVETPNQHSETTTDPDNTSGTVMSQHPDSTQASQAEACEPNSKEDPPAQEKKPERTATDQSATLDKPVGEAADTSAPSQPAADLTSASNTDDCYRYEGETCIYTEPSSGLEYVYSAEQDGWVRRDGGGDGLPVHAPTLENCYYEGEHYCFKDAAGTVFRLDPETNSWKEWTPPAEADAAVAAGATAGAAGLAAAAVTGAAGAVAAVSVGPAAAAVGSAAGAAEDGRCFHDVADGNWCCRDDTGALCRWDAAAGHWLRADTERNPDPAGRGPAGARKRRLNRGSSDESEHDTDDDDDGQPAAKRAAAAANGDGGVEREEQQQYELPSDGSGYEWDAEKCAWFPKIDEEFLALHRLNYGFDAEGRAVETAPILETAPPPAEPPETQAAGKQRKLNTKKKPEWFQLDDSKNTKVYVSGLADDTTEQEFVELMSKCGLVMKDSLKKNAWKIKLYRDDYGVPKGDAICTYIKIESVHLALSILDGYEFKGNKLCVQKASFDLKGQFDPTKKPKKRALKKKDREKMQLKQEKLFAWQPDKIRGQRERHERVVVIKNLFSPEEFKTHPEAILEYQQDLRDECGKCGPVRKVVINDRHKDGVAEVIFQEATDADSCVLKMNSRWFAGRRLDAATWDGKTKYRVEETEAERVERLAKWEQFITGEDKATENKPAGDKPVEDKPAGDKPSEDKSFEDKPSEDTPSEDKLTEDKPAEDKPGGDKPSEDKPSEDKPSEDKPIADKPAADKPAEDKPSEDKPAEDTPSEDKTAGDKSAADKPSEEKSVESSRSEDEPA